MPTQLAPTEVWFPVLTQVLFAVGMATALVGAGMLLGKRVKNKVKSAPYECGITAVGSVKFYLVAMLFILFDIEAIFLYPWAVVFRELKLFAFFEMLLFVVLVLAGFFYIWKKGVLNWAVDESSDEKIG
jgi:NADH-quinone oxidoreductase subunit A